MKAVVLPVSLRRFVESGVGRKQLLALSVNLLRNIVFLLFLLRWSRKSLLQLKGRGVLGTVSDSYSTLRRILYGYFLRAPGVRSQVQKQVQESISKIEAKLVPQGPGVTRHLTLPKEGWTDEQVRTELESLSAMEHVRWEDGRVSGAVYHGGKELLKLQSEAIEQFAFSNPIHPDVFPGVRKMEAEIVAMVLAMFNAPPGGAGVVTSGGTESILMACLSARQKAYSERRVTEPEIILPESAHCAFQKACYYFNIKAHVVACPAPSYQVDASAVARLVNGNTILLVGSAPNFPHGIIDDLSALSRLASRKKIPLHVDCCLGSFLMPFLHEMDDGSGPIPGSTMPPARDRCEFDFRLTGVTSLSCDTHKYGFAPKGTSVLLYRTKALRAFQYFIQPDWPGGVYASPGFAGSRPGALIAGCWASLMSMGESGYRDSCRAIVAGRQQIERAIRDHAELGTALTVLGHPLVSVVAFTSTTHANPDPDPDLDPVTLNIYNIADALSGRGWSLNALQSPPAIHIAVTKPMLGPALDGLVADLVAVVRTERDQARARRRRLPGEPAADEDLPPGDMAALYGVAGSLPNKAIVVDLAQGFLDTLYKA
ncbi:MAG: hypothetical protein M1826_007520 [Phylliscum demangeonii]|nr:MAG: hypothetical protein M1826_007520 [Phylliscum demangeonii]